MAFFEVVLEGRQNNQDMLNVFHYQSIGTETPDWDFVSDAFRVHLVDNVQGICGSRVTWEGITVREDSPGAVGVFYPFTAGTLTGSSDPVDHADVVAMKVNKFSGGTVRPTHGWFMQGGINLNRLSAQNAWEAATQTAMLDYAEDIRIFTLGPGESLAMVIKARNPTAPNTQAYSPVATFTITQGARTQRSRLPGVGS